jgi:hypothetical protein
MSAQVPTLEVQLMSENQDLGFQPRLRLAR